MHDGTLHIAALLDVEDVAALFINKIKDIDCRNEDRGTPHIFAADSDHSAIVKLLCESGANVHAVALKGKTPV